VNKLQMIQMLNVTGTRGHTFKLEKIGCIMDIRKFFAQRVVGRLNISVNVNAFKGRL